MSIYPPIENFGAIGDLNTAALVGLDASIEFMCFPRFDSPSIFAALLDRAKGGSFRLAPIAGEFQRRQRYLPGTNILLTRFLGIEGIAAVSDFMPLPHLGRRQGLVRRVKSVRGTMRFRMVCDPRFDYGRAGHTVTRKAGGQVFVPEKGGQPSLCLRSNVPLCVEAGAVTADFKLKTGQTAWFVLEDFATGTEAQSGHPDYVSDTFKETMNYWLSWIAHSRYRGRWREMVDRSALTLKLLTSQPHGSIVAAPTFGLPESLGGSRNWDYRYTWIRDASFTLDALMRLGYLEEATAFMEWIEHRCRHFRHGNPLQVMYRIDGQADLSEKVLRDLEGYQNSRPVRIGNAAREQLQLDIYGELLDSIYIYDEHGGHISYDFWMHLVGIIEWVCRNWRKPDRGIWEVRDGSRPFLYSRVLCWVALDRAIRLAVRRSFPSPIVRWHRIRDEIYNDIYHHFWDKKLRSFVQSRGSKAMDAAALLMPLVKIISPSDPRWRSTLEQIEKTLVEDSLVYRYRTAKAAGDGLPGNEGTFSMCSFWYARCLAEAGDLKKARFIFEKALGYANHLGLYAEQLGPSGEHLGNFPQGISHIALVLGAWTLNEKLSGSEEVHKDW